MKKRVCKKETVEMNIDKLSNVKSTLNERNKRIRILKIKGIIIALLVIALAIVTVIGVRNPKAELKAFEAQELSVVKQYEELDESEDVLEETQDVQFSAFFLRDIDNDEELEKIKGTCKRIGEEDILYMDLKLNGGQLKDAKIEIDSKNFFLKTSVSKDDVIKNDYISDNTTQIELNDLDSKAQKLMYGKVRSGNYFEPGEIASALNNNINNYSRKDNKIIFTAKYIKDGKEIDIRKEIDIAVDWYVELAQDKNEKVHVFDSSPRGSCNNCLCTDYRDSNRDKERAGEEGNDAADDEAQCQEGRGGEELQAVVDDGGNDTGDDPAADDHADGDEDHTGCCGLFKAGHDHSFQIIELGADADSNDADCQEGQDEGDHGVQLQNGQTQGHNAGDDQQGQDCYGETNCLLVFAHVDLLLT